MKLLLALFLAATACASGNTVHVEGTGGAARRTEVRIENNNWNEARVYLLPSSDVVGRRRIAAVSANMRETAFIRLISPTFRFYVTLLADRSYWVSDVWNDQNYTCFKVVIHNYLAHSYVIPCPRRRG